MIYFIRAGDAVKIGWSKSKIGIERRRRSFQTGNPEKLSIVRVIEESDRWVEGWLHGFFSAVHLIGEWYQFKPEMLTIDPPPLPEPPAYEINHAGRDDRSGLNFAPPGCCPWCDRRRRMNAEYQRKCRSK